MTPINKKTKEVKGDFIVLPKVFADAIKNKLLDWKQVK